MELTNDAYTGQVDPAPAYPAPDLSFLPKSLPPSAPGDRPWILDEVGRLVVLFSEALLETLRPTRLAGQARGQLIYRYVQEPGSVDDLDVVVEIFAETNPARLRVRVCVDVPSADPLNQSGSLVALRAGDNCWHGETDEAGSVDFAAIPAHMIKQLRVEVTPAPLKERIRAGS